MKPQERDYTLTHQVQARYYMPGSFVSTETTRDLENWDPDEARRKAPKQGPYGPGAYVFTLREWVLVEPPFISFDGIEFSISKHLLRESNRYFLEGTVYTLTEVRKLYPMETILVSNIESNSKLNPKRAIRCAQGTWQLLEAGDVILKSKLHKAWEREARERERREARERAGGQR